MVLVGVGRFGRNHLRVLQALHRERRIHLLGVAARNARRARAIAARYRVRAYPSLDAALADGPELVDIVTPASTHAELVRRVLPHAHAFVEKPLALTRRECAGLYELARRHSRRLGVGHIFRFNRAVDRVKQLVRGSKPHLIRLRLTGRSSPPGDVGAILTYLHVFDLLDELLGASPRVVRCLASVPGPGGLEQWALVALDYPGGLVALAEVGWIGGAKRRELEVECSDCRVRCDLVSQRVEYQRSGRPAKVENWSRGEPLRHELEQFLGLLGRGGTPRPSRAAVLRVMRMAFRAQASLHRRRSVRWRG